MNPAATRAIVTALTGAARSIRVWRVLTLDEILKIYGPSADTGRP